ncbi:glucose 1-dehydrogenase [Halocalculus aciditolerans]|uniref:Glucose dehydrogenase n=1 Tax=Halocalculus aciditolerans TaxID=1383812 RepID=A0A830FKU7_9EURY|nr:glucose 1-dehydrogenase [Halocalculus aciditolerans]GGL62389.1 glucose dehydrogenase [Halocalculus aciditolerans]
MHAIAVGRDDRTPRVVERDPPTPASGEALVRVLRVGVDGTDHAVIAGDHGGFPEGADELVLGHEAVGVVVDANDTDLDEGAVVAPTVRRPPAGGPNPYFDRGEPDMAPPGGYVERGIDGADGYMAEYVTSPAADLVELPDDLADYGFLVEPVSVVEKAFELAAAARSSFRWEPDTALVLGNGPLGLLAVAALTDGATTAGHYDTVYCLGQRDPDHPSVRVLDRFDAAYVDARDTPLAAFADAYEPADLVVEATGHPPHAVESLDALAPNGVAALLGVPEGTHEESVPLAHVHRDAVLSNKAVVGSVNSNARHFRAAADALADMDTDFLDALTTVAPAFDDPAAAFREDETTIKTAVELATYEER